MTAAGHIQRAYILRTVSLGTLPEGHLNVTYSTDNSLLARARADIKADNCNAPTQLILMDNFEIGSSMSEIVSSYINNLNYFFKKLF